MNTHKNDRIKHGSEMPAVDDGWWESVLGDEQKYSSHTNIPIPATVVRVDGVKTGETKPGLDWELAKNIFSDDRIIELKVN